MMWEILGCAFLMPVGMMVVVLMAERWWQAA